VAGRLKLSTGTLALTLDSSRLPLLRRFEEMTKCSECGGRLIDGEHYDSKYGICGKCWDRIEGEVAKEVMHQAPSELIGEDAVAMMKRERRVMATREQVIEDVFAELRRAEKLYPSWPDDVVHGAAIVGEEAGSVLKAALDYYYRRGSFENLRRELTHVTAMGLRFLLHIEGSEEEEIVKRGLERR